MAKNTITAEIKDRSLGLVSSAGPVHSCVSLTYTYVRDGAGRFDATFPITDKRLLAAALKDTLIAFSVGGVHVFTGVVERRRRRHNKGRGQWIISGPCILGILAENSVGRLVVDDRTDGPQLVLDATNVPGQTFTLDVSAGSPATNVNVYKEFANETGLAALVKLAEMTGEHFRAATDGTLRVVWLQFDSPQTQIRLVDGGGPTLHRSRDVAIIEDIEVDDDGEGIVNRIYPVGAGQHEAELTLAAATMAMPAGYTMNTAENYIEWDAGQVFPSVRRALVKEFRSIAVIEPEYPYGDYWLEVDVFAIPGATTIDVDPLPVPLANGATLDLNGLGVVTITLTADAAAGDVVINVAALAGPVSDVDRLKYTIPFDPIPTEHAANQLAAATLAMLEKLADPARRTAYRIVARNLPEAVKVGMTIPVRSHSYGVEIDDDLIILEITRSITSAGRAPVQLRVAAADWWENDADTEIARQLEEARAARSGSQPIAYTSVTGSPTPAPPMGHRAQHLEGGTDPLADTTPTAGLVPQADGAGKIAIGWLDQSQINTDNVTEGATNLFILPAELIKLAGIETAADVTDAANVLAAGAVMVTGDQSVDGLKIFTALLTAQLGLLAPTIDGSTAANGDVTIQGTTSPTRAGSTVRLQPNGGNVAIGALTPNPAHILSAGVDGAQAFGTFLAYGGFDAGFGFYPIPGTPGAETPTLSGALLGSIYFGGWDTNLSNGARIYAVAAADWGTAGDGTDNPAEVRIATAPDGSATLTDRIAVRSDGDITGLTGYITDQGIKRVATQFDKNNTTLATVTGLSVNVIAGKSYSFEAILHVTPTAAGGMKFAISGTATATSIIYWTHAFNSINTIEMTTRQTALGGSAGVANDTAYLVVIRGAITVNAAGTLLVQFAQNVASGISSILVGSTFAVRLQS